jgi:type IV fimbrial biogenesis protein FimT
MNGGHLEYASAGFVMHPSSATTSWMMNMKQNGLTLVELLFTLLILALLLGIGIPSFSSQIQSTQTRTSAFQLLEAVNSTRTLAISQGHRATMRHKGDWNGGWQIFVDSNDNGLLDEGERLISEADRLKGVQITGNTPLRQYVSFIPNGESRHIGQADSGAFQAGTFNICPETGGAGYKLVLARSGRARIDTISADECSSP